MRSLAPMSSWMSGYCAWKAGSAGIRTMRAKGLGTSIRKRPRGDVDAADKLVSASSMSASSFNTRS